MQPHGGTLITDPPIKAIGTNNAYSPGIALHTTAKRDPWTVGIVLVQCLN
jgi:hypothetical protein